MEKLHDVIIIGGGPAGLTSAIYSSRAALSTLVIEKASYGGQIVTTTEVENYPGAIDEETGQSLTDRMHKQAKKFGTEFVQAEVIDFDFSQKIKTVKTEGETYSAKGVILAVGANPKKLGIKGEQEFTGGGVSYCATCDGAFFKDIEVFVIGGGDTALQEALFLTKFASHVTIVHRRDKLRATKILQEKAFKNEKISFKYDTVVKEIKGDGLVSSVVFENVNTKQTEEILPNNPFNTLGVFVFAGFIPNTDLFSKSLNVDGAGYFVTGEDMKLQDGIYAVGDCRQKSLRQVVTATADGAIASMELEKYIEDNF